VEAAIQLTIPDTSHRRYILDRWRISDALVRKSNFVNFLTFNIRAQGFLWTLSDAIVLDLGVLADASDAMNSSPCSAVVTFCNGVCSIPNPGIIAVMSFLDGSVRPGWLKRRACGDIISGVQEVPLPTALPLFATGLGALGLLGSLRKRRDALAA